MGNQILESLKEAGNDVEGALRRFVDNEAMYVKFLKRFADDKSFSELKEAVEKGDLGNAFVAAHTLKGVAGNLGFTKLFDITSEVTEKLRLRSDDRLDADFAGISEEYNAVIALVSQL